MPLHQVSNFGYCMVSALYSHLYGCFFQVHGEVTDPHVDTFDREKVFIERILAPLVQKLPQLKIVMEHITTKDAVNFIESCKEGVCCYKDLITSVCPYIRSLHFRVLRSCCCNGDTPASPPQQKCLVSGWLTASQLLLASTEKRNPQYVLVTLS